MVATRGLTKRDASRMIGRSQSFIGSYIARGIAPSINLLLEIADKLGFSLILYDRENGTETIVEP